MYKNLQHIDTWIFDLDNTLYPPSVRLFDQIEVRMAEFVQDFLGVTLERAHELRSTYWRTHGTTLAGLMNDHNMDPDQFLLDVHDIDFSALPRDPILADRIADLPGRKLIYTNGTAPYAQNVIAARGLSGLFDGIYGVEHAGFRPKPERVAFETVFDLAGVSRGSAIMFEDEARNLAVPHAMGVTTVHVAPAPVSSDHIQYHTSDLTDFLTQYADTVPKPTKSNA